MVKVTYRNVPKNLEQMSKPSDNVGGRSSINQSISITEHYELEVSRLIPFKKQAREEFSVEEIQNLSKSIIRHGVRQPLTIIKSAIEDKYEVVSGERRLRAAVLAGLQKVPCIIIKNQSMAEEIAVVENIMRKDLHPVELSKAFCSLTENNKNLKQKEIASRIGVSERLFSETLKYSTLPSNVKRALIDNNIKERDFIRKLFKSDNPMNLINNHLLSKAKSTKPSSNIGVLRVILNEGGFRIQSNGVANLTTEQKNIVKIKILTILE